MSNKPIIAITAESEFTPDVPRSRGTIKINWNYPEVVAEAGGVPIIVPPTADMDAIAGVIDGWLITGGMDIDARYWNEENHEKAERNDDSRTAAEMRLFKAIPKDLPVLGICYGCQFLNVAEGGTLEQHIPDRTGENDHSGGTLQEYPLQAESRLAQAMGTTQPKGQSWHHQAVGRVADSLTVVGRHEDGTVEAIESTGSEFRMGVQWHPERTPDLPETKGLLSSFIEAAAEYRAKRISR